MDKVVSKNGKVSAIIDDGTQEIALVNTYGRPICKIYIRPADWSILDRVSAFQSHIEEMIKPLATMNLNSDGTVEGDGWETLKKVEKDFIQGLSDLFDTNAEDIFKRRSPFSSVNGKFFGLVVVEALSQLITEAVEKDIKAAEKRVSPYLEDKVDKDTAEAVKALPEASQDATDAV